MYLEYLADGHTECPLLAISPAFPRVSPTIPSEAEELYLMLLNVAMDYVTLLEIHGLTFICPIDGCRLTARVADQDHGVVLLPDTNKQFTWELTRQTWKEVLVLLYDFTRLDRNNEGYQCLDETSNISVLISTIPRRGVVILE